MNITMETPEDNLVECEVIDTFDMYDNSYAVLFPIEQDEESENYNIYIYKFREDENGEKIIEDIDDEEEFLLAKDRYSQIINMRSFYDKVNEILNKGDDKDGGSI